MEIWSRRDNESHIENSIVLATDGSGSMSGRKIEDAKKATINFAHDVDLNRNELALVLYGHGWGGVKVVSEFCRDLKRIQNSVKGFYADDGTPFLKAMRVSYDNLLKSARGKPILVIITDGLPTDASPEEILKYGAQLKRNGVRIITVAIGRDADRDFLRKLASKPEDSYFAKYSGQLTQAYKEIASGLVLAGKRA